MMFVTNAPLPPPSLKRQRVEDIRDVQMDSTMPVTPCRPQQAWQQTPSFNLTSNQSPMKEDHSQRSSPALTDDLSVSGQSRQPSDHGANAGNHKRRKLTTAEKEQKKMERENKMREKAEERAKREEDKRVKDEERRKRNEAKEEKKREKEMEKQQREEEKRKKDKAQLRLNAFFKLPSSSASPEKGPQEKGSVPVQCDQSGALSAEASGQLRRPLPETQVSPTKPILDYDLFFLPFALRSHSLRAPENIFLAGDEALASARSRLDDCILSPDTQDAPGQQANDFKIWTKPSVGSDGRVSSQPSQPLTVREIFACLQETLSPLKESASPRLRLSQSEAIDLLRRIPMKYLHFAEDVRPPYFGTFTGRQPNSVASRLGRNPFTKTLPDTNYDYDSEVEWEEPEEGEDLDSEGEEEAESLDGEDDMEGFLDDEGGQYLSPSKRRHLTGDIAPICSGLLWEDQNSRVIDDEGAADRVYDLSSLRMDTLLEPRPQTISPFSSVYWPQSSASPSQGSVAGKLDVMKTSCSGSMEPPRRPLQSRPIGLMNGLTISSVNSGQSLESAKAPRAPKRLVPAQQLAEFKEAIRGSDLTKLALIEALKRRFPKVPKDAISNTLNAVAHRVGAKEVDKRWVLFDES